MSSKLFVASAALLAAVSAHATVTVATPASTYSQTFNSLASTGSGISWSQDSTLPGWVLFGAAAGTAYGANTGSTTGAGFYSFGSTGSSDRALGSVISNTFSGSPLPSGSGANVMAVGLTNATGAALNSFTLSYDGEQWRNNGNANAQTLTVSYGYGATYAAVSTWLTTSPSFTFSSPQVGASQSALDGNLAANRVAALGGTVATQWASGSTLWIRWVDVNDANNDHFLAIDNVSVSFTAAAVPEPSTYAMLLAGLGAVGFIARRRRA